MREQSHGKREKEGHLFCVETEGGNPLAIFAGGGTAGHINPAVSMAKALEQEGYEILYIGSAAEDCMDREIVGRAGLPFLGLAIVTPLLKVSFQTLRAMVSIFFAMMKCRRMMKKRKPALVVGTGGFVSLPVLLAAAGLGLRTAIHEQNVYPGFTNRHLSRRVDRIFLTFAGSSKYFGDDIQEKLLVSGLPLVHRPVPVSLETYAERIESRLRLLVVGGSLGSEFLNRTVAEMCERGLLRNQKIQIVLSCGRAHYDELKRHASETFEIVPFITDMASELERADLLLCRAGSSTVFEGIISAVPAIVVPSPNVAGDHQRPNAKYWESIGAAICAEERELSPERLSSLLSDLAEKSEILLRMKKAAMAIEVSDPIEILRKELLRLSES